MSEHATNSLRLPSRSKRPPAGPNVMKDPFYSSILFHIEKAIVLADEAAQAVQVAFNDSQIRSILNKVRKQAEGGTPQLPEGSERDQLLAGLYGELVAVRSALREGLASSETVELPREDWILSLRTVEDSIRRHSSGAGSRAYLDYVKQFLNISA